MLDLANKLEAALKYRVEQGNFPITIFTGQGDYEKETPSLIVHVEYGSENPLGSGNWTVTVNCDLRYPADSEDLPAHREPARDVIGQFMDSQLADLLSEEADDLHVFGIMNRQMRSGVDGNQWLTALTFEAYCCPMDIPLT